MNRALHRFTLLVTGATFVLIIAGSLVTSHDATLAQLFFCTMVSLSVFTSPGWNAARAAVEERETPSLRYMSAGACLLILAQLVLGATLRHSATWDQHLPTGLLLAHMGGALLVTVVLAAICFTTLQRHGDQPYLRR